MSEFTLSAALDWIQGGGHAGHKAGLDHMYALLDALGNPERGLRFVHVAGTNGKGSTCAVLERALRQAGMKTGLYTSPYLCRYNERIRVNGAPIPDGPLLSYISQLRETAEELIARDIYPTPFEMGTALAYMYFRDQRVDIVVLEVGLGGRFDSTNTIIPDVSVIAAIGLDHMKTLGDTLEKIAFEKAGIIKSGVPVVAMPQEECVMRVFRDVAAQRGSALTFANEPDILAESGHGCRFTLNLPRSGEHEFSLSLPGAHQAKNASLALTALDLLGIPAETMRKALPMTAWPGRLEWIDGVLLDGAHNPQGVRALSAFLSSHFPMEKITLVTGMMRDKQYETCAAILAPQVGIAYATAVQEARAASPEEIARAYERCGANVEIAPDVRGAVNAARAHGGLVVVAGSLYLVGEVREMLHPDDGSI